MQKSISHELNFETYMVQDFGNWN